MNYFCRVSFRCEVALLPCAEKPKLPVDFVQTEEEELATREFQRRQLAPGVWGAAGVHLPVAPRAGFEFGVRGNLYSLRVDNTAQTDVEGQVYAGVTVGLGGSRIQRAKRD